MVERTQHPRPAGRDPGVLPLRNHPRNYGSARHGEDLNADGSSPAIKTIRERLRFHEVKGFAIPVTGIDDLEYQLKLECVDERRFILGHEIPDREVIRDAVTAAQIELGKSVAADTDSRKAGF